MVLNEQRDHLPLVECLNLATIESMQQGHRVRQCQLPDTELKLMHEDRSDGE